MKLRHRTWDLRKKLEFEGEGIASNLRDGLKSLEATLGVAENELRVPGGLLDQDFNNIVDNVLQLLETALQRPKQNTKEGEDVVEMLSQLGRWVEDRKPLVIEKVASVNVYDRDNILRRIMYCDNEDDQVSVIHVTGMPGTGKTTLSQCIYHSREVFDHFNVRHWVGMSENQEAPTKLLDLVFRQQTFDIDIRRKFHDIVDGKRYLLILDDVTQTGLGVFLHELLGNVGHGSKIVLTTTDAPSLGYLEPLRVARNILYELEQLSEEECWASFKSIAFGNEYNGGNDDTLSAIRLDICKRYYRVPRLVNNIAVLLSYIKTEGWANVRDTVLTAIQDPLETTLLKINLRRYGELPPNLQQCLSYCSLFPTGYEFEKAEVIHLWEASDNLSTQEGIAKELVGDKYFRELQNNGFLFKHSKIDHNDGSTIFRYKMDPIVHAFLKHVRNHEFYSVSTDTPPENIDATEHLSFIVDSSWTAPSGNLPGKELHSLLYLPTKSHGEIAIVPDIAKKLSRLRHLRILDLVAVNCGNLGDSLKDLTNLRYLRLGASAASLPESISELKKLCTLDLRNSSVVQLPTSFHRLDRLRHLYTGDRLIDLPPKFGELKSLQTLDVFIVGDNNGLEALDELNSLSGKLKIRFLKYKKNEKNLENLKYMYLTELSLVWESSYEDESKKSHLDHLSGPKSIFQPEMDGFYIYSVVSLCVKQCSFCHILPAISSLPRLKSLQLWDSKALEYIESGSSDDANQPSSSAAINFFPSLEYLTLANLPNLPQLNHQDFNFPRLVHLRLFNCPKMMTMPHMTMLETLEAHNIHEKLLKHILSESSTLKKITIVSVDKLDSLSINLPELESLIIRWCPQIESLVIKSPTSLKLLEIHECGKLLLHGALKHLSNLEKLGFINYNWLNLENRNQDENHDASTSHEISEEPWQHLQNLQSLKLINILNMDSIPSIILSLHNLKELSLRSLYEVKALPEWIGNFTNLQRLTIHNLPSLTTLPESLSQLSALQQLELRNCPKLKQLPNSFSNLKNLRELDIRGCYKLVKLCENNPEAKAAIKDIPGVRLL